MLHWKNQNAGPRVLEGSTGSPERTPCLLHIFLVSTHKSGSTCSLVRKKICITCIICVFGVSYIQIYSGRPSLCPIAFYFRSKPTVHMEYLASEVLLRGTLYIHSTGKSWLLSLILMPCCISSWCSGRHCGGGGGVGGGKDPCEVGGDILGSGQFQQLLFSLHLRLTGLLP